MQNKKCQQTLQEETFEKDWQNKREDYYAMFYCLLSLWRFHLMEESNNYYYLLFLFLSRKQYNAWSVIHCFRYYNLRHVCDLEQKQKHSCCVLYSNSPRVTIHHKVEKSVRTSTVCSVTITDSSQWPNWRLR